MMFKALVAAHICVLVDGLTPGHGRGESWSSGETDPIMVKRWLAALGRRATRFVTTHDPYEDPVSGAERDYEQAVDLATRHDRTGDLAALQDSVSLFRRALAAIPAGDPDHASALCNLGIVLRMLFVRTGELATLSEAVQVGRQAVAATPAGDADRSVMLSALGTTLLEQYLRTSEPGALTQAVHLCWEAVATTPTDDVNHAAMLNNLGIPSWRCSAERGT